MVYYLTLLKTIGLKRVIMPWFSLKIANQFIFKCAIRSNLVCKNNSKKLIVVGLPLRKVQQEF